MLVLVAFAPRAFAHQTSVKYIDLTIRDAHTVDVSLRCASTDVTEPMGLPADAKPTVSEALGQSARVAPFVHSRSNPYRSCRQHHVWRQIPRVARFVIPM